MNKLHTSSHTRLRRDDPPYQLLRGYKNFLVTGLPFGLIWLASDWNTAVAALTAFFTTLFLFLRQNYRNNRRLAEMAREVKENAR